MKSGELSTRLHHATITTTSFSSSSAAATAISASITPFRCIYIGYDSNSTSMHSYVILVKTTHAVTPIFFIFVPELTFNSFILFHSSLLSALSPLLTAVLDIIYPRPDWTPSAIKSREKKIIIYMLINRWENWKYDACITLANSTPFSC